MSVLTLTPLAFVRSWWVTGTTETDQLTTFDHHMLVLLSKVGNIGGLKLKVHYSSFDDKGQK